LKISARTGQYQPEARDYQIVIHGQSQPPTQFTVNGKKIALPQLISDQKAGTITLILPDTGQAQELTWL
jgi:hypothetical protein